MSEEEDHKKDEEKLRKTMEAIASYKQSYDTMIQIGIVLLEQGRDLTGLKETIDGLGERQVREVLLVSVAEAARFHFEKRQAAPSN